MLIGLGKEMTPIDFEFTRSRSQVSLVKNVNMVFVHYLDKYSSQSFHISHANWSWWRHDIELIRSKVKVRRIT